MLIPCPCCGNRDVSEFTYLGDAKVRRPDPAKASEQDWTDFIYQRDNPRGAHSELWQHIGGCRLVIEVARNTLTHEIMASKLRGPYGADKPKARAK